MTNELPNVSVAPPPDAVATFDRYALALIDFLGQSRELKEWDFRPQTSDEIAKWQRAVQNTLGRVQTWREKFENAFREHETKHRQTLDSVVAARPPDRREAIKRFGQTKLLFRYFSDTVIVYTTLQNEHGFPQISSLCGLIATCGSLLLEGLVSGAPMRGAIEVGVLSHFPTGDPYGPALACAHHMESKQADYPRILVGPRLLSYLDELDADTRHDAPRQAIRRGVAACRAMLTRDAEGHTMIDYLNDPRPTISGPHPELAEIRDDAFRIIVAQRDRFERAGEVKIAGKYGRVEQYFRSRGAQ